MSAKTTRILKEARSLFWPWCAVIIAGALRLVEQSDSALLRGGALQGIHPLIEAISFLGFFVGIPLLATLSLGNEFHHRTLQLLLSQPVSRMEIWSEKLIVTIVAVLAAALVFRYGQQSTFPQDPELWVVGGALIIAMISSATFWTLVARSTMGGLALNAVSCSIPLVWHLRREGIAETMTTRSVAVFAGLSYGGVMPWLCRRSLARFQVTGGLAGDDLLMAGPKMMPRAVAEWLRCRSTSPLLNLIRKELRLLRPVWLISLLAVPAWICLPVLGFTVERGSALAVLMLAAFTPLIAVLAGTMSLGEERTSGTHSWHLTLPVPARRQWLIKLVTAMFTGLVCAGLLPISLLMADRFIFGSTLMSVNLDAGMTWLLGVLLLSFASFWCACAVNGTVSAALAVFPALIALLQGRKNSQCSTHGTGCFSGPDRTASCWWTRRLGCEQTIPWWRKGLHCLELRSLRKFPIYQGSFKHKPARYRCTFKAASTSLVAPHVGLRSDPKWPAVSEATPRQAPFCSTAFVAFGHHCIFVQFFAGSLFCLRGPCPATDVGNVP